MDGSEWLHGRPTARSRLTSMDAETRFRLGVALLAVLAAVLVWLVATRVFPYHSLNHDEGVYLQQSLMLLDGQLFLQPPVEEAFRPWFFVEGESGMYPKYTPVPAAMFAPAVALGVPRLALAAIAAAMVALVAGIGRELFDRPTGLVAGVVLLASPLFVVNTSVFLPYAPTTLLNCAFALAYLRADRTGSQRVAAAAGVAIGLAFFARPYTAVLFALPFVGHALWTLRTGERAVVVRQGIVAACGLVGVAVTLLYNAVLTGSPLLFPYLAFAPHDGLGFGYHELLGHEVQYTPSLALETNTRILRTFATDWMTAGVLGVVVASVGLLYALARRLNDRRLALAGVVVTVPLGELYFWGTYNMIGDIPDTTDGLIYYLGPYYHFDMLVPAAVFGGLALRVAGGRLWSQLTERFDRRRALTAGLAVCLVSAGVGGVAAASSIGDTLDRNRGITDHYEAAYEPFEERSFSDALVLLPQPYGPWLNHPFQTLRNDPGYDGDAVYALEERPFAVVDAFPDRTLYRYTFRNPWPPVDGEPVQPRLRAIRSVRGDTVGLDVTAGVPTTAELVSIRVESDAGNVDTTVHDTGGQLDLRLLVSQDEAVLVGESLDEPKRVPYEDRDEIRTSLYVDYGTTAGFSYELLLPVERTTDEVRALSPREERCRVDWCGGAAAYMPGNTRPGVSLNTTLGVVG